MKKAVMEKFIKRPSIVSDMVKDSELIKEIEDFLKGNNIEILEMIYNRSWEFDGKPTFDIVTGNLKSLEELAQKTNATLENNYDKMSFHRLLLIKKDRYDLYIYRPMEK